ncbi:Hypothetical protein R9X50_00635000 [Acrodontium crateriforme]|uniref:Dienelactone hydrolase domain-containing protein n=1 Tax=Acrodontium crateriforme TaxID=150365 RepID=A0AAQ3M9I7_9PEZI|nr:Hypothetical protein R9X50_00635000 [Acrodontium crateriforme]
MSATIAKPSDECCTKGGTIHEGEPRGTLTEIAGLPTYIVEPAAGSANGHVLLFYPDVWGFYQNNFLIMDGFADAGFKTVAIDYFRGDAVQNHRGIEPDFDFPAWALGYMRTAEVDVPKWEEEVKAKFGVGGAKFACVGYCFGAPFVMRSLAERGMCEAGGFAHPAFLKEEQFTNLQKPLFLSCAETDFTFPHEFRNKAVDIMVAEKKRYGLQLFQGVEHGFAPRGDNSPYARYVKEQSLKSLSDFFSFWLAQ